MKAKKRTKKKKNRDGAREKTPIRKGKGVSYILECRYCSRKAPAHLHAQIMRKLKETKNPEGKRKRRFLVCKDCIPRYVKEKSLELSFSPYPPSILLQLFYLPLLSRNP